MTSIARGSRRRWTFAAVALALILLVAVFAMWPRSVTPSAEDGDPHSGHISAVAGGSDAEGAAIAGSAVAPPESHSTGDAPETSLAAAAGSEPLTGGGPAPGAVTTGPSGETYTAPAAADAELPTRDGAAGLGRPRPDVKPTDVIDPDSALGGCSDAYGADGQCLPTIPPSQAAHAAEMVEAGLDPLSMAHPWTCPEVREYFPKGIAVRVPGVDPDGLDADEDGMACEPD